jgi:hypothetical protein
LATGMEIGAGDQDCVRMVMKNHLGNDKRACRHR